MAVPLVIIHLEMGISLKETIPAMGVPPWLSKPHAIIAYLSYKNQQTTIFFWEDDIQ